MAKNIKKFRKDLEQIITTSKDIYILGHNDPDFDEEAFLASLQDNSGKSENPSPQTCLPEHRYGIRSCQIHSRGSKVPPHICRRHPG